MATLDRPRDELPDVPELAVALGLEAAEFEPYGRDKAKVDLSVLERLTAVPDGKLVAVTAVTPTRSGEGKTTTAISLTQGPRLHWRAVPRLSPRTIRGPDARQGAAVQEAAWRRSFPRRTSTSTSRAICTRSRPRTTCSRPQSTRT